MTGRRGAIVAVCAACGAMAFGSPPAASPPAASPPVVAKPARIVSTNVCTDQLVLMVADRARIASLSYLAADPRISAMSGEAAGLPVNHGLAEQIIPFMPDIVFATAFTTRATNAILRRLGYRVIEVPVATDLAAIATNIRTVADAIGQRERGRALATIFAARIEAARSRRPANPPLAALYWANGYTSGNGTLANAIVEAAGFRTLGRALGVIGTAVVPLESLLVARPDVLIVGGVRADTALAGEVLGHPALARAFAGRPRIGLADNLWLCGTPHVAAAVERLARYRAELGSPAR